MNLYIIGPITGIENDNRPEFERVRWTLKGAEGVENVGIPHDFTRTSETWDECMRASIRAMLNKHKASSWRQEWFQYNGIALLDGWKDSKGARIEKELAESLGIPCKPWTEWLNEVPS